MRLVCIFDKVQSEGNFYSFIKHLRFEECERFGEFPEIQVVLKEENRLQFEWDRKKIIVTDLDMMLVPPTLKDIVSRLNGLDDVVLAYVAEEDIINVGWASFEYYRNPYLFCFDTDVRLLFIDRFNEKIAEITKVISREEMVELVKKHSWDWVKIGGSVGIIKTRVFDDLKYFKLGKKSLKFIDEKLKTRGAKLSENIEKIIKRIRKKEANAHDPYGYVSYSTELDEKGRYIFPRYFIREELRKRGVKLEEGLAEKYAKELGIEMR
jgi:hypothetical protein